MATPTLAKHSALHQFFHEALRPANQQKPEKPYDGKLIENLNKLVEKNQPNQPKPPQPDLSVTIVTPSDEERKARNAEMLNALWILGEQMAAQAFEIRQPKPDPLLVALNGFPDVNTSQNYYDCAGGE